MDIKAFEEEVDSVKDLMTASELKRAKKVISDLRLGASAYQKSPLPPVNTVNAKSAAENGQVLTDTIVTWIKKGFVARPFVSPPLPGFRVNPLGAVVRNGKVRPILNMSGPVNKSFNDNVLPAKPEDYRLQGFCWLGRYFVETRLSFGGVPSPCNFDRLGNTKDLVVCLKSGTRRSAVFRALDDSPFFGINEEVLCQDKDSASHELSVSRESFQEQD